MSADWVPVFLAFISLLGVIVTGLFAIYTPKAVAAINAQAEAQQAQTQVQVVTQERAAVYRAAETLTGTLQAKFNAGQITPDDLHHDNPEILADAAVAIVPVQPAAANQDVTVADLARLAVARVDTAPKAPIIVTSTALPPAINIT